MLKEKYHPRRDQGPSRIRTYCKDIERYTQARIQVDIPQRLDRDRRDVRFEIQGKIDAIQKAIENIQGEFILRKVSYIISCISIAIITICTYFAQKMPNASQDRKPAGVPLPRLSFPGHSGPRKAARVLDKRSRMKLAQADPATPHLLTEKALKKHDIATGTCELRQFACAPCDNVWWRVVSTYKSVSRCYTCRIRYDALPREFEFGIGLYTCSGCGKEFKSKCTAQTDCPCFDCETLVSKPFIHPKFNRTRVATDRSRPRHKHCCDKCHGMGQCPTFKRVIYPSKPHDSTGSTVSTFLSQLDFNGDDAPLFDYREAVSLADDLASMSLEDSYSDSD